MNTDLSNRHGEIPERFVPDTMRGELIEAEHLARYWWIARLAKGRRVLDVGCGVGYGTAMLAEAGASRAIGVDIAESVIEAASAAGSKASYQVAGIHDLPFDDASFDVVVCFEVIEHVERPTEAIDELIRVLSDDGVLVVSSPNPDAYVPGNPHHVHEFRPNELRSVLAERLPHVQLCYQHNWITSTVMDDRGIAADDLAPLANVEVAKVSSATPVAAPYAIAVASRTRLHDFTSRMVATGLAEPRRWLKLFDEQQQTLFAQRELIAAQRDVEAELAELHVQLRLSEEELARAREAEAEATRVTEMLVPQVTQLAERLERADRVMREMKASVSWRVTRPLRTFKRLLGDTP